jgi:hypothetical protein
VRYPVYIPSKGRPGGVKVAEALGDCGIDYKIVVEPAQYDAYEEIHGGDRLLTLPEDGQGIAYARQWIKEHCADEYHWQLDDDKSFKKRVKQNGKWKEVSATAGEVMGEIETYVGEYGNVAIAGPKTAAYSSGTDKDADGGGKILFNRQVCSFLLIKTSQAAAFRAGTIEDTDYNLQVLTGRDGQDSGSKHRGTPECTALFHRLLVKGPSGSKKGGNHDGLYYGRRGELRAELARRWPAMKFSENAKGTFSSREWHTFKQSVKK